MEMTHNKSNGFMIKKATVPTLRLNNGFDMPILCLGVWRIDKNGMRDLIINAIKIGYRHFDCAGVGTTGNTYDEDAVLDIDTTISLETTWHDMESLVSMGLVRSIGISNYDVFLTRDCLAYSKVKPAVNKIETHPYFQCDSLVRFSQKHGICVTAHTPLGGAIANAKRFGSDPVSMIQYSKDYKKSLVQIVLRWGIQRNTIVIPKTSLVKRLEENFNVFDFEITEEDMEIIKGVDRKHRTNHPTKVLQKFVL
ncbi:hypothetical protein QYF36_026839 [Acer negundo]|nr:hypothetical protein QYF36_026839 [Acer negundo]